MHSFGDLDWKIYLLSADTHWPFWGFARPYPNSFKKNYGSMLLEWGICIF